MTNNPFKKLFNDAKQRDSYWVAKVVQTFTEELYGLMQRENVSKSELARRIGSTPAYVTKVMRGNTNFTVESMVRLVRAVNGQVNIHVCSEKNEVQWFDLVHPPKKADIGSLIPNSQVIANLSSYRAHEQSTGEDDARTAAA